MKRHMPPHAKLHRCQGSQLAYWGSPHLLLSFWSLQIQGSFSLAGWALMTTPKNPGFTAWVWGWMPPDLVVIHCFHSPCLQWFKAKQQKRDDCTVLNFCFKNKNQRWESRLLIAQPIAWKGARVVAAYASWWWTSRLWASRQPLPPSLSLQTRAY